MLLANSFARRPRPIITTRRAQPFLERTRRNRKNTPRTSAKPASSKKQNSTNANRETYSRVRYPPDRRISISPPTASSSCEITADHRHPPRKPSSGKSNEKSAQISHVAERKNK